MKIVTLIRFGVGAHILAAALTHATPAKSQVPQQPNPAHGDVSALDVAWPTVKKPAPPVDDRAPFTPTVKQLLGQLSLDEKISLVHAVKDPHPIGNHGYMPGVPRLGIPERRDTDSMGIQTVHPSTAIPARLGLAATFDREGAYAAGGILGAEGRALGIDELCGPQVGLARLPNWWSNDKSYGEDPYLAGELAIQEVTGTQSQGLMAQVKHFAFYHGQNGVEYASPGLPALPTLVDDQTAREIYLKAFEYPVIAAKPASIMTSYQGFQITPVQSDATWATDTPFTLLNVLRRDWGFTGYVMSDHGATHSVHALVSGTDQDYPYDGLFGYPNYFVRELKPLVDPTSARFDPAYARALDRAAANVLYADERFGLLQGPSAGGKYRPAPRPDIGSIKAGDAAIAERLAEEAAVLLKNDDRALPLRSSDLVSVAVIGPTASQLNVDGGKYEWSHGFPDRDAISPLQMLRALAPAGSHFVYAPGIDWIGSSIPPSAFTTGLTRTQSDSTSTRIDPAIDYGTAGPNDLKPGLTYTWSGDLNVPATDTYYLWIQKGWLDPVFGAGAPNTTLTIDGVAQTLASPGPNVSYPAGVVPPNGDNIGLPLKLSAGRHRIVVKAAIPKEGYYPLDGRPPTIPVSSPVAFRLAWSSLGETIKAAVTAAKAAKVAIVFADDNSLSLDPVGSLAANENALIEAVAKANPNTIVVLSTGDPVLTPWLKEVKAVLETWYPGQEGGTSTAKLLLGLANPSGKLPLSWPVDAEHTPFAGHPERVVGDGKKVTFSEGIFMGYRWYDQQKIQPQFCFGCGLSYTKFTYSDLEISPAKGGLTVSFVVRNSGTLPGAEVPQVYVGAPENVMEPAQFAVRKLVGFDRIMLQPGRSRHVRIAVSPRELSYWSSKQQAWVLPSSDRTIYVGPSSQEFVLSGTAPVPFRAQKRDESRGT